MRAHVAALGSIALTLLALPGCGGPAEAAVQEDQLVLELGGATGSLRGALAARGIVIAPPMRVRSEPPVVVPVPQPTPQPTPTPQPVVTPTPAPQPGPGYRIVKLGRNQTLAFLSRQHLGDANRFREILTLNGWSDADARRLQPGQDVKIPIDPPR